MKTKIKIILLSFILIILSASSFSQKSGDEKTKSWEFGVELFPNYSIISKDYSKKFTIDGYCHGHYKESISFRFVANKTLNKHLSLYLGAGAQFTGEKVNRTLFYIGEDATSRDTVFHNISNTQFSVGFNAHFTKRLYLHHAASALINFRNRISDKNIQNFEKFSYYNYKSIQNKTLYSFSFQMGLGFNLIHKESFKLYLQPNFEIIFRNNRKKISPKTSTKMYGVVLGTRF